MHPVALTRSPGGTALDPEPVVVAARLIAILRGDSAQLDEAIASRVVDLAEHHRVAGLLAARVSSAGSAGGPAQPAAVARRLETARLQNVTNDLAMERELHGLDETFSELREPWMLVKGPVLSRRLYDEAGARRAADLDIVVAPSDFAVALAAVERAGGTVEQRNWPLLARLRLGQIVVRLPHGIAGDLHWHLLNTPEERTRFSVDMTELRERSRTVMVGGTAARTLDPIDTLLHLCLHGTLSGGHLLVWLEDVTRAVAVEPPDWDELVVRARRYRLGLACAVMLSRARAVLGAEVPDGLVSAVAPRSSLTRLLGRYDVRQGPGLWSEGSRSLRTLLRATAGDDRSTIVAMAKLLAREVALPALRERVLHVPERAGLTAAVGGSDERRRYLAAIAADAVTAESLAVRSRRAADGR